MPTQNPFTSAEQQNAQREYITETAKNYQNETDLYSLITDAPKEMINDKGLIQPLEYHPNASLMASDIDGGATPTIGSRDLDKITITYAALVQGRGNTYEAMINNNKETAEDEIMRSTKSDLKQQMKFVNDYVSRGDGTWKLAEVSAYTNPAAVGTVNTTGDSIGASQLVVKGWYTFWNAAGTTQRTGTVGAGALQLLSRTSTTVTFATNIPSDVVATDIIVPEIGVTNAATGALMGLPQIIDAANTYWGKARGTDTRLQSYVKSSAGTLTAGMLAEVYFGVQQRGGYFSEELAEKLWMVVGVTQKQNYYNLSLNAGAVVGSPNYFVHEGSNRPQMDHGMKSLDFTWFGAPLKTCNSVRGDEIYYLNPKELLRAVLKPLGHIGGGFPDDVMLVNSTGVPIFTMASYHDFIGQVFSPTPHRLGKIAGLTITSLVQQRSTML